MHIYAYTCVYIYLSSCQSINLSFQSHLMIVVRWVLCLWEQQSIWIALPSGLAVPSCICIFPCIGICLFFVFLISFLQTCRYNCWKYTMLFRYCDFMGPRLFGLYPNGQFTFGLSPFGLFWNTKTSRLLPFGLLWHCVTQLKLYTVDELSSTIFCCLSVCQASVTPDKISTFSNIYKHTSHLLNLYHLIPSSINLYWPSNS